MWPSMAFEVILQIMKNLHLLNVSIHRNLYQKLFIYEYARTNFAKFLSILVKIEELTFFTIFYILIFYWHSVEYPIF